MKMLGEGDVLGWGQLWHGTSFLLRLPNLLRDNPPRPRGRTHNREVTLDTQTHASPQPRCTHPPALRRAEPATARQGLLGWLGHPALTLRFPLVLCLFFPPMVAVSAALSNLSPQLTRLGHNFRPLGPEKGP